LRLPLTHELLGANVSLLEVALPLRDGKSADISVAIEPLYILTLATG
jgi:hypothetical protein